MSNGPDQQKLQQVKSIIRTQVLSIQDVSGIGYNQDRKQVVVTVTNDQAIDQVREQVGEKVAGYDVVFENIGSPEIFQSRREKVRPVRSGISIGNQFITAGTLGYIPEGNGEILGLSNTHVLTPMGTDKQPTKGQDILQPGPADGGRSPEDKIGELEDWVPYDFQGMNYADAAVYRPTIQHVSSVIGKDGEEVKIQGVSDVSKGDRVWKAGRTTGYTEGIVRLTNQDIKVGAGERKATFVDQYVIEDVRGPEFKFTAGGDSGSLLLNMDNEVVGLIFAGSTEEPYVGIANPIEFVTGQLGVDISPSGVQQVEAGSGKIAAGIIATTVLGTLIYRRRQS